MTSEPTGLTSGLTSGEQTALEWAVPINRSGWAIAAGYVSLVSIPFLMLGPVAIALGVISLVDLRKHPTKKGHGRAWFAIVYGALATALLAYVLSFFIAG